MRGGGTSRKSAIPPADDEAPGDYLRFVCFQLVEGQRSRLGLFQALDDARDSDVAPDWALALIRDCELWFIDNLGTPDRFSRGSWRGRGQPALSWFKSGATDHIAKMYELKTGLEACGIHVDVLRTRDPGHILYEDRWQVAAEPGRRRF